MIETALLCEVCRAPMISRVYERTPDGRANAGIVCCSVDPWHSTEPLDALRWARLLALADALSDRDGARERAWREHFGVLAEAFA